MISLSKICSHLSMKIQSTLPDISDEKREQIEWGLYVRISNSLKMIATLIFFYLIGIFKIGLIIIASFGILRLYAGGYHAKSDIGCLILNFITFLFIYLTSTILPKLLAIILVIYVIALVIMIIFAPSDSYLKPIISSSRRLRFKITSIVIVHIMIILSIVLERQISNIIILSIVSNIISILANRNGCDDTS